MTHVPIGQPMPGASLTGAVVLVTQPSMKDSGANLRNKIRQGRFTRTLLIQCLKVIGATTLRPDD